MRMKKYIPSIILAIFFIAIGAALFAFYFKQDRVIVSLERNAPVNLSQDSTDEGKIKLVETVIENLSVPWEGVSLPDGSILITERAGVVKKIGNNGFEIQVSGIEHIGEGGLLGLTLHPDYRNNQLVYLYYTTRTNDGLRNVVERYKLSENQLTDKTMIVENIPAAQNHNGGRIKFGPDGFLYITTGDAQNSNLAQDKDSLAGKILRLRDDGGVPEDNPFGNSVYSYGHRNVQGLTWDGQNNLWATEHGRSGAASGYDELNFINKGANYGWPEIQGDESREGMESPVINSGATTTWAPSGMTYRNGSLFFAGLRGEALYEYEIGSKQLKAHYKGEFGRLRNIITGPDGNFYLFTNNTDGRGSPKEGDDKIIKINSNVFENSNQNNPYLLKRNAVVKTVKR